MHNSSSIYSLGSHSDYPDQQLKMGNFSCMVLGCLLVNLRLTLVRSIASPSDLTLFICAYAS